MLFLENHDGESWNQLMKDLCVLYAKSFESEDFTYMPHATACASRLCMKFYSHFWAKFAQRKQDFVENKTEICCYVASCIALSAQQEFQLGNVF